MDFRNGDNGPFNVLSGVVFDTNKSNNPMKYDLNSFLTSGDIGKYDISKFEILNSNEGVIIDILNRFFLPLTDSNYCSLVVFDVYQATILAERVKSISYHLYKDTRLYYTIMWLNHILHPAELNREFLMTKGLVVLNGSGLEKLEKIFKFIKVAKARKGKEALAL